MKPTEAVRRLVSEDLLPGFHCCASRRPRYVRASHLLIFLRECIAVLPEPPCVVKQLF
jgi:hypothetical protein